MIQSHFFVNMCLQIHVGVIIRGIGTSWYLSHYIYFQDCHFYSENGEFYFRYSDEGGKEPEIMKEVHLLIDDSQPRLFQESMTAKRRVKALTTHLLYNFSTSNKKYILLMCHKIPFLYKTVFILRASVRKSKWLPCQKSERNIKITFQHTEC